MTTIVTRSSKGSALTYEELDQNFTNLKTDVETLQSTSTAADVADLQTNVAILQGNITTLTSNAATQATSINTINTNITTLTANAATQAQELANRAGLTGATFTGNVTVPYILGNGSKLTGVATSTQVTTLDANLGTATTNITALQSNAATQQSTINTHTTDITNLWSNAASQSTAIAGKTDTTYVDTAVSTAINNLINSAPGTLDTLGEISANLAQNADTTTAIINSLTSTNANVSAANAKISAIESINSTQDTAIANLWANAAAQTTEIAGKASTSSLATVATTGAYSDLSGKPTLFDGAYSSLTGAPAIPDSILDLGITDGTTGQVLTTNGAGGFTFTTVSGGGSSYGNTEVAAYLPTYTGSLAGSSSIVDLYANAATQATEISTLTANAASQATTIAGKADTASLAAVATSGSYNDLSNKPSLFSGSYSDLTDKPSIPGQDAASANQVVYKNGSNVATGSSSLAFDGSALSSPNFVATNSQADEGGEIRFALPSSGSTLNTSVTMDIYQNKLRIFETGGSARGAYIDLSAASASVGTNLLAGGGSSFTGDLAGSDLIDSTNGRVMANAYPVSKPDNTIPGNSFSAYVRYKPVYTNNQVQQPPLAASTSDGSTIVSGSSQILGLSSIANVALQSGYGASSQNRNTAGTNFLTTVTPVTANSMSANDRVRSVVGSLDINLSGKTWGTMSTASQNSTTLAGINGVVNILGPGSVGGAVGGAYGSFFYPGPGNTANVQYSSSLMAFQALQSLGNTTGKANVVYARGLGFTYSGFSSNLRIQNAVGVHTHSGWAGNIGTSSGADRGYVVLNEDSNTAIQTNGNLTVSYAQASGLTSLNSATTSIFSNNINIGNPSSIITFDGSISGLVGKSQTGYSVGFGTTATRGAIQATFNNSNYPQIGPVSGTVSYSVSSVENIGGTITGHNSSGSMSGFTTPTGVPALTNLGDTVVMTVIDQTNSKIYRVTFIRTSTISAGDGSISIEQLI